MCIFVYVRGGSSPATKKRLVDIMKSIIKSKVVKWYDPRVVTPPFNKLVVLAYDSYRKDNVYLGYYVNGLGWQVVSGIYTFPPAQTKPEKTFPDAWAYLPLSPFDS